MGYYIGVDLGTSSLKLMLVDPMGGILKTTSRSYDVKYPRSGWSEQSPEDWWSAFLDGADELLDGFDSSLIKAIGVGGQMHGLVALDENDRVLRPAILWNDGRTFKEVEYLNCEIGKDKLSDNTANIAFAGFTAPKILWMKKNEPELFVKIKKIMLPKDYLNYKLTGSFATDLSDASGMLLLDVKNRCWSKEMIDICGITEDMLPKLYESYEVIGTVKDSVSSKLGIKSDVLVVAGAGDNAAAAVGTGTVGNGKCNISLGTSGTVFISADEFSVDTNNALHSFCHSDGRYHLMGCILSAASCNKWLCENVFKTKDIGAEIANIKEEMLGNNEVYFLPYLMGERSPVNDTDARGVFIGMTPATTREEMLLAVIEGVTFAIRDNLEVARSLGLEITTSKLCGGGARSELWQKILANALGLTLELPSTEEGPGYGGAILAMVGAGEYGSVKEAVSELAEVRGTVCPTSDLTEKYEKKYKIYKQIYPALKYVFKNMRSI